MDLSQLEPSARSAAMRGGTDAWGVIGDDRGVRYAILAKPTARRRCSCGCKRRATHRGMSNGVCLMSGCELRVRRWVKGATNG